MKHEHLILSIFYVFNHEDPRVLRLSKQCIKFILVLEGITSIPSVNSINIII